MQSERDDLMKERAAHESATSDKYNAMKAQAEAEEIARTFEETVRSLRIQMRQEKEQFNLANEMIWAQTHGARERD